MKAMRMKKARYFRFVYFTMDFYDEGIIGLLGFQVSLPSTTTHCTSLPSVYFFINDDENIVGIAMTEKCMSERAFNDHDDKELTLS